MAFRSVRKRDDDISPYHKPNYPAGYPEPPSIKKTKLDTWSLDYLLHNPESKLAKIDLKVCLGNLAYCLWYLSCQKHASPPNYHSYCRISASNAYHSNIYSSFLYRQSYVLRRSRYCLHKIGQIYWSIFRILSSCLCVEL